MKVVNVFTEGDEPNRGFVTDSAVEPGIYVWDEYGHYAVADAEVLPGQTAERDPHNPDDRTVFSGIDHK